MTATPTDVAAPGRQSSSGGRGIPILTLVAAALLTLTASALAADRSAKLLAADAARVYATAGDLSEPARGEAYYRILSIVDMIRRRHPSSIEAAVLKTGRVLNTPIRIDAIEAEGRAWAERNPAAARDLAALVAENASAGRPTDDSGESTAQPKDDPPGQGPGQGVVARLDDQTRAIRVPPPARNRLMLGTNPPAADNQPRVVAPALKVSRSEVFSRLGRSVVLILYVATQKDELFVMGTGTGFFIAPGRILTNAHVAAMQSETWDKYKAEGFFLILNNHAGLREARVLTIANRDTSMNIDAAILEPVGYSSPDYLSFAADVQVGEWIAIGGFPGKATDVDAAMTDLVEFIERRHTPPLPEKSIPTLRVDDGILSNKYVNRESRALTLQYSMETTGGNSGSPIVNACGQVVGLHYSGTREIAKVQKSNSGDYYVAVDAAKYNSAVSSKELRYFFDRIGLKVRFSDDPCQVG